MTDEAQKATTQEVVPQALEANSVTSADTTTLEVNSPKADLDVDLLVKEREEAKREAQKLRQQLRAKETAEAEAAKAQMTEQERLATELADLRKQAETWAKERQQIVAESAARDIADELGIIDHRDALALTNRDEIVYDDAGRPENLKQLFSALVKAKPYLVSGEGRTVKTAAASASAGVSGGPTVRLTAEELKEAERAGITPERWVALKSVKTLDDWKKTRTS